MIGTRLHLEVTDTENQTLQEYDLDPAESPIWLGRDRASRIVLAGASVSRRHCRIESRDDGWVIVDSSSAGSAKNGVTLPKEEPVPLQNGDLVVCANFEIRVAVLPVTDPTLRPDPQALRRLMAEVEEAPVVPPRIWFFSEGKTHAFELPADGASLAIGRSAECQIRLADPLRVVSALHARVERNWAGVFVHDTSRNGIYVNGRRVEDHLPLQHGDRITIAVREEDPDRPLLVYAAEGVTEMPAGPQRGETASEARRTGEIALDSNRPLPLSPPAPHQAAKEFAVPRDPGRGAGSARGRFAPVKRKASLLESARSNLLFVLVLVVSGLALLTILVWGIVLLRGR